MNVNVAIGEETRVGMEGCKRVYDQDEQIRKGTSKGYGKLANKREKRK